MTLQRAGVLLVMVGLSALVVPVAYAIQDIVLVQNGGLSFGNIVVSTAGTISISPTGVRSVSGGVLLGTSGGSSPASFTVTGEPLTSYSIVLPPALLTKTDDDMVVDTFTNSLGGSGTLDVNGTQTVSVGATLHLKTNQGNGAYSGSLSVTVTYE